jgi:hypothetical protein
MKLKYVLLALPWIVFLFLLYEFVWGNHFPGLRNAYGRETLRACALLSGLELAWYMAAWEESIKRKCAEDARRRDAVSQAEHS